MTIEELHEKCLEESITPDDIIGNSKLLCVDVDGQNGVPEWTIGHALAVSHMLSPEYIEAYVRAGGNLHVEHALGSTPMHEICARGACCAGCRDASGLSALITSAVANGGELNRPAGRLRRTPVHVFAHRAGAGTVSVAADIARLGGDYALGDAGGMSALHIYVASMIFRRRNVLPSPEEAQREFEGIVSILETMIGSGASLTSVDNTGTAPIHLLGMCSGMSVRMVEALAELCDEKNVQDARGDTFAHHLLRGDDADPEVVEACGRCGWNMNTKNHEEETPGYAPTHRMMMSACRHYKDGGGDQRAVKRFEAWAKHASDCAVGETLAMSIRAETESDMDAGIAWLGPHVLLDMAATVPSSRGMAIIAAMESDSRIDPRTMDEVYNKGYDAKYKKAVAAIAAGATTEEDVPPL